MEKYVGLNNYSIGIELDNPGTDKIIKVFKKSNGLFSSIIKKNFLKYNIKLKNVLAHSDIAPNRNLTLVNYLIGICCKKVSFFLIKK